MRVSNPSMPSTSKAFSGQLTRYDNEFRVQVLDLPASTTAAHQHPDLWRDLLATMMMLMMVINVS